MVTKTKKRSGSRGGRSKKPFTRAFESVSRVMREGAAKHPENDWVRRTPDYHLARAEEPLRLLHAGDQRQDHLSHAATRLLMALTLRELG
jgi:dATP/dGTP diphosphohydrolase, N-terminal